MPRYNHFEDLPVWQEAAKLHNAVLDLLEEPSLSVSAGFRNQLDRASLSVSNNIAEGFERATTAELMAFLAIARGSASEVRSMLSVVAQRPKLASQAPALSAIRSRADACVRQLTAWMASIEDSPVQGKRRLTNIQRRQRESVEVYQKYRIQFLRSLQPNHPLYNTAEAQAARAMSGVAAEQPEIAGNRPPSPNDGGIADSR